MAFLYISQSSLALLSSGMAQGGVRSPGESSPGESVGGDEWSRKAAGRGVSDASRQQLPTRHENRGHATRVHVEMVKGPVWVHGQTKPSEMAANVLSLAPGANIPLVRDQPGPTLEKKRCAGLVGATQGTEKGYLWLRLGMIHCFETFRFDLLVFDFLFVV